MGNGNYQDRLGKVADTVIGVSEASEMLGLNRRTIQYMAKKGHLASVPVSNLLLLNRDQVLELGKAKSR